ncbi:MAG TPA: cytochrome c oxidase assembly factor Coa1 family protein [Thermoanaerobaculia bacterium]|jgi:hypothetical protein|nr:cytochrome c oxidase assembly factor Coa1 family protein [Thermoanaerobaculia bacterium]
MTAVPPPPPAPLTPQPSKSSGCLKWGLIGCSVAAVIVVVAIAGIVALFFAGIRRSDVYSGARDAARRDPRVIAALGEPIHTGWWVTGSVNINNEKGNADFHFPLIGSKERGRVHAIAELDEGKWRYTVLTVTPRGGPPIDVLQPAP